MSLRIPGLKILPGSKSEIRVSQPLLQILENGTYENCEKFCGLRWVVVKDETWTKFRSEGGEGVIGNLNVTTLSPLPPVDGTWENLRKYGENMKEYDEM